MLRGGGCKNLRRLSGCGAAGSAGALGASGRRFEPCHSDHPQNRTRCAGLRFCCLASLRNKARTTQCGFGGQVILLHELDNHFFEAYKRLDRLCADLYSGNNGISAYIADMESKTAKGRLSVPSWDSDCKNLKHVRWVRNRIAHESALMQVSETSDLTFVKNFYDRILSEEDPLTLLRKADTRQKRTRVNKQPQSKPSQSSQHARPAVQPSPASRYARSPRKAGRLSPFLAVLIMILLILVFFVIRINLDR